MMSAKDDMRALHIPYELIGLSLAYVSVCITASPEKLQDKMSYFCIAFSDACLTACMLERFLWQIGI
jgi:hypothetical protein